MMDFPVGISTTISGGVVGLVLGLVGGGGSILAVPLLVYAVGNGFIGDTPQIGQESRVV